MKNSFFVFRVELNKKKRSQLMFPWWCLFIAYGLSFILVGISTFFIIVRGIQFGDLKTQKWLTSLISGFFSSILLIQPLKVTSYNNKLVENKCVLDCWSDDLLRFFYS
jgi:hypothetical protein